jgi:hypothetical protein
MRQIYWHDANYPDVDYWVAKEDVDKFCLDKQKVKEAIELEFPCLCPTKSIVVKKLFIRHIKNKKYHCINCAFKERLYIKLGLKGDE